MAARFLEDKMKQNNPPKKKIAFICVHNSCRSQIAESLAKHFRGDEFDFYSAGTETKPEINQDAVRLIKKTLRNRHGTNSIF